MLADADDDVEISGLAAAQSRIAFACNANALAVARAGLDAYFERVDALDACLRRGRPDKSKYFSPFRGSAGR